MQFSIDKLVAIKNDYYENYKISKKKKKNFLFFTYTVHLVPIYILRLVGNLNLIFNNIIYYIMCTEVTFSIIVYIQIVYFFFYFSKDDKYESDIIGKCGDSWTKYLPIIFVAFVLLVYPFLYYCCKPSKFNKDMIYLQLNNCHCCAKYCNPSLKR